MLLDTGLVCRNPNPHWLHVKADGKNHVGFQLEEKMAWHRNRNRGALFPVVVRAKFYLPLFLLLGCRHQQQAVPETPPLITNSTGFPCHIGMKRVTSLVFNGVAQIACQSQWSHLGNTGLKTGDQN